MNRRYEYIILFIICALTLAVIGCATTHTIQHGRSVEAFYNPWLNQPFEELLENHLDPQQSIPIGQGNYRHTFVYDIDTQTGIGVNLLATLGEMDTGGDIYYYIYVYVNSAGIIYKVDYRRRTATWQ